MIGDVNPDFSFGFSNNVTLFKASGSTRCSTAEKGGDIYNFTKQWMFQD